MFHERLKKVREEKNVSREQAAKALGITYSALSKYETNKREPDFELLDKMANYYDVSVDYLLGRTKLKYRFNPDRQYDDLDDFLNDPILRDFAKKHLQGKTPAEIENIEKMFELIKKL